MAEFKRRQINISKSGQNIDKNDKQSPDNIEHSITPPARENTEVNIVTETTDDGDNLDTFENSPVNKDTSIRQNIETEINLRSKEKEHSGIEPDFEQVMKEMEKIVAFTDDENDEDFKKMEQIRRDYEDRMTRTDSRASFTFTPRDEWGFTTRTIPELKFSWNSTVNSTHFRTADNSRYTNQYLRSTASIFSPGKTKRQRKREKTGVTWSSRVDNRMDGRKLFCFDQYEECQIRNASRQSKQTDFSSTRNASRLALESREAMFRRAMSLLSARCASVRQDGSGEANVTLGAQLPKYFYVTQDKPLPMEPLKAWRGYHGNIYFEPININPMKSDVESARAQTSVARQDPQHNARSRTSVPKARASLDNKENRPTQESRSESRQTNKSSVGSRRSSNRPMAYLDKQTVLNRLNESIHEDIVWLEGTENTGSLAVRPKTYPERMPRDKERDLQYNKERIKKGSVAHKLYIDAKSRQKPKLSVSGGKFTPPNSLSPLLRTQTQYSLSSQRLTTNSPDPFHLNESKLPPLDQIRASLKHMDSKQPSGKLPYTKSMTLTEGMKPFVKYSPDVVAKFAQQANI